MKNLTSKFRVCFIGTCLLVFCYTSVNAQPGWEEPDPVDTPIDGGIGLLVGAGLLFGVRKLRQNLKCKEAE